ncbi:unnamed protein product [Orchesella dallaii]|uniref:Protein lines n=1 Tax=Orchesella dallaii TaxID=48710 RepID=A0ABP1RZ63_9HEXA
MEGPALKRPRLQPGTITSDDWNKWSENLATLQTKLLSGCLCHMETLELQRPFLPKSKPGNLDVDRTFLDDYALQFISTMNLLSSTALKQQATGFICRKVMDMASGIAMDEGTWEMLIEYLDSPNKFITLATSKAFVTLLMWTKLPNLHEIFDELFKSVMVTTNDPFKLSHILEIIRGVVDYRYEDEHPLEMDEEEDLPPAPHDAQLQLPAIEGPSIAAPVNAPNFPIPSSDSGHLRVPLNNCAKVEVDTEIESEVKNMCVSALEIWWNRLLTKFQNMMKNYEERNEAPIVTFLTLWLSIISVKSNLSVIDTKHYYMHLSTFVPLLTPSLPPIIWKKLIDVFNEILCYGSTLSLQEEPSEEPCDLAHLIIRCVKSRQFLPGVPYSRNFLGFGGSCIGNVDWEWESENSPSESEVAAFNKNRLVATRGRGKHTRVPSDGPSTSSSVEPLPCSSRSLMIDRDSTNSGNVGSSARQQREVKPYVSKIAETKPAVEMEEDLKVTTTICIGHTPDAAKLDATYNATSGDGPLLQKVVLLVLKSVAVTVKETRCDDSDSENSSSDESGQSASESDISDMIIIERSIREVFRILDAYVKSLQPYHPEALVGEWIVKLFSDQDDALIEGMLCALDTFTTFKGRIQISDLYRSLDPTVTFNSFVTTICGDPDVLLDLLMSNETCFLLYLLRFLKYAYRNWNNFVSTCGRDLDRIMGLLIRVRIAVGRLVERSLFPYNINPVLRLLERCEEMYETNGENNE